MSCKTYDDLTSQDPQLALDLLYIPSFRLLTFAYSTVAFFSDAKKVVEIYAVPGHDFNLIQAALGMFFYRAF